MIVLLIISLILLVVGSILFALTDNTDTDTDTNTCNNLFFVHIPKTGGVWVTESMEKAGILLEKVTKKNMSEPMTRFYKDFGLFHPHYCHKTIVDRDKVGRFSFCFVAVPVIIRFSISSTD